MLIQWNDSFSTGVSEIDQQHQEMIRQLNRLAEAAQRGRGQQQIMSILKTLADCTEAHFRYEEQCMEKLGCPAAAVNRLAHQQLLATLQKKMAELDEKDPQVDIVLELHCIICDWLRSHIPSVDCHLRDCIRRPG